MRFSALREVHLTAKDCVVLNRETQCVNVAFHHASSAELDPSTSHDVAVDFALDEHVTRPEVSGNACTRANRQAALGEGYGSFDTPVDHQIFPALHFSTNDDGLANSSRTIFGCHESIPSRGAIFDFRTTPPWRSFAVGAQANQASRLPGNISPDQPESVEFSNRL
jgi:hypothetical protein